MNKEKSSKPPKVIRKPQIPERNNRPESHRTRTGLIVALATAALAGTMYSYTGGKSTPENADQTNLDTAVTAIDILPGRTVIVRDNPSTVPIYFSKVTEITADLKGIHIETPKGAEIYDGGIYTEHADPDDQSTPVIWKNREWVCMSGNTLVAGLMKHNNKGEYSDEIADIMSDVGGVGKVCIANDYVSFDRKNPE